MFACAHGKNGHADELVKLPAEHGSALFDDVTGTAGGKFFIFIFLFDGLDLKIR